MKIKYSICNLGLSDTTEISELRRKCDSHSCSSTKARQELSSTNECSLTFQGLVLVFTFLREKENTADWKLNSIFRFILHPNSVVPGKSFSPGFAQQQIRIDTDFTFDIRQLIVAKRKLIEKVSAGSLKSIKWFIDRVRWIKFVCFGWSLQLCWRNTN